MERHFTAVITKKDAGMSPSLKKSPAPTLKVARWQKLAVTSKMLCG